MSLRALLSLGKSAAVRRSIVRSGFSSISASPLNNTEKERNLRELEEKGFTVVHDVFTAEQVASLQKDYIALKAKAERIMSNTEGKVREMEENNQQIQSLYWKPDPDTLILQAGEGRYDLYKGFGGEDDGAYGTDAVQNNQVIAELVKSLLVDNYTNYAGVIHSRCGSENQYWHRDTDTLSNSNTNGKEMVQLDDFYFTCLVPCTVPFTRHNGCTEFLVGSHRLPASSFDDLEKAQAEVPLGSALLFNGKCSHRGAANTSDADRPAIYMVYHKLWYNDGFRKGVE